VVAVAHEAVNRGVISALCGRVGDGELPQPTGCWNQLVSAGGVWSAPVVGAVPGDGRVPVVIGRSVAGDPGCD
jgi:hypothetical protein